jgi:2-oxoglutarate/2-oxoacid ferredoxin oxidoreductase subunit alpha
MGQTFAIGIGGAAGQGVATPGEIFAKIFSRRSRRGLHLNAYNAYPSIIRGGHTSLTSLQGFEAVAFHKPSWVIVCSPNYREKR